MRLSFDFVFVLTICLGHVILVKCERNNTPTRSYATCIACMAEVLLMEDELMLNLQGYKEKLKEKLQIIRFYANNLQRQHTKSEDNPEEYLSNPLKAFTLIKRMHADWIKWQDYMKQPVGNKEIDFTETIQYKMPTSNDLQEACAGIVRIQDTFQMEAVVMSSGILNDKQHETQLSAIDCYTIGDYLFNATKYVPALNWFNASLDRYTDYDTAMSGVFDVDRISIWNSIAMSHYEMGDKNATANAIIKALEYRPDHTNLLRNLEIIQEFMEHDNLCRGAIPQKSKLFCRYNTTSTPFLKIAPIKMEEVSIDPYIVLYHDIIYDSEIEELKRLSLPQFERSLDEGVADPARTGQVMLHSSNKSLAVARINRRLWDISGLILTDDKNLQVVSYGMGGHYDQHLDYESSMLPETWSTIGNRLATILIYLNDVEKGGGTAFSAIKKVIQPKKGTALLWHHLDNSGNGILKTIHGSCPVLVGSKWTAIRFIHYLPQLFVKPCYK